MKKIIIIIACFLIIFTFFDVSHANSAINEFKNQRWEYILGDLPSEKNDVYNFNLAEGWQTYKPGNKIIKSEDYNYIWLRVKLPDYNIDNPTLYLPGVLAIEYSFPYQLYFDKKMIYENGKLKGKLKMPQNNHSLVSLPNNWQGKYLYFRFYNKNLQFKIGQEIIASIAPYYSIIDSIFNKGKISFILSLIYLLLGIFVVSVYFFRLNEKIYLYLGLFLLAIAIYSIRYNQIISVLFSNFNYELYLIYYFSVFILVGSFSFFISQILISKKFIYKAIGYLYFIAMILAFFSYFLHPHSIFKFLKYYNISVVIFALFTFFQLFKIMLKDKEKLKKEIKILFIGITIFGISVLLFVFDMLVTQYDVEIINEQFNLISYNLLSFGIFFFVLSLLYLVGLRFSNVYTDLVKYSKELEEANKKLNKLDHFKDEFINTTLEEFKFPLNNMISKAESLIINNNEISTADTKNDLANIIKIGQGLDHFFDSFIDYEDIKKGKVESESEHIELSQIIDYMIDFFEPIIIEKNIKLKNNIEKDKFIIIADKSQLIQAFYNLLEYITTSFDSGEILFNAEKNKDKIKIKLKIDAKKILFKYKNDFSDNNKSLFITDLNEFRQTIIQQLIKKQGGHFRVEKLANRLLSFTISLSGLSYDNYYKKNIENVDSVGVESVSKKDITKNSAKENKKSILIIGEKTSDNEFLQNILSADEYRVQFKYKDENIQFELNNDFALVVVNIFSLDQKILELCEKIRDKFKLFDLPILVIVSKSEPNNLIQGFETGINDFIQKPFTTIELKTKVRNLLILKEKVEESIQQEQNFLRAQIKPHFLYNTLDTIAYLCENRPKEASDLVIELANYLRYSFNFDNLNEQVSVKKELDLVDFYINIQKARFGNKISVEYNLEPDLIFTVPPLIIQPLVENSVEHGLLNKKENGHLEIAINDLKKFFEIKIIDDGVGMTEKEFNDYLSKNDNSQRQKVGLKNINHRLKRIYNQELKIEKNKREGTTIKIKIPKQNFKGGDIN